MNIVKDAGSMDADGDGHVSAQEALAFASRLKDEAAPLLDKARNGMVNPEAEAAVGTLDSMLSLATNTMSAHNFDPNQIAASIDKAAEGADMIAAAKKAISGNTGNLGTIAKNAVRCQILLFFWAMLSALSVTLCAHLSFLNNFAVAHGVTLRATNRTPC